MSADRCSPADTFTVRLPVVPLRNGVEYPMIGLGCASGVREEHVTAAVLQGYSLLDTAAAFEWGYREDEVSAPQTNDFRNVLNLNLIVSFHWKFKH